MIWINVTDQAQTGVPFPASLLRLSTIRGDARKRVAGSIRSDPTGTGPAAWDFPATLRKILKAYLDDGYPDIGLAASIVGCSVRTLQRRLDKFQLSYTEVVQKARFEATSELLRNPGTKVIEAANAVGFDDPAHFARAFRRQAGISPNQYQEESPV